MAKDHAETGDYRLAHGLLLSGTLIMLCHDIPVRTMSEAVCAILYIGRSSTPGPEFGNGDNIEQGDQKPQGHCERDGARTPAPPIFLAETLRIAHVLGTVGHAPFPAPRCGHRSIRARPFCVASPCPASRHRNIRPKPCSANENREKAEEIDDRKTEQRPGRPYPASGPLGAGDRTRSASNSNPRSGHHGYAEVEQSAEARQREAIRLRVRAQRCRQDLPTRFVEPPHIGAASARRRGA